MDKSDTAKTDGKRRVFVVGGARSGTTLMTRLLNLHPDIYVFNEIDIFRWLVARGAKGNLPDKVSTADMVDFIKGRLAVRLDKSGSESPGDHLLSQQEYQTILQYLDDISEQHEVEPVAIYDRVLEIISEQRHTKIYGDKTPNYIFYLKHIKKAFPDALVIFVIRHPEKFMYSYKYAWRQAGGNPDTEHIYHPVVTAYLWQRTVDAFRVYSDSADSGNVMMVHYEELLETRDQIMSYICKSLSIDSEGISWEVRKSNTSFRNSEQPLDKWERDVCAIVTRKGRAYCGYADIETGGIRTLSMLRAVLSLPVFIFRALPFLYKRAEGRLFRYVATRLTGR